MDTTVFDVVHMFSERGISAVPIIDENGVVVNLYETVDVIVSILHGALLSILNRSLVQTLVRLGAYQSLDLTIAEALNQRSPDFPGVVICTASDSIGTLLQLIKKRRVHRLVVVEGEVCNFDFYFSWMYPLMDQYLQEEERKGGKKGRLLGIITLSDVLRYVVGPVNIQESAEPEEPPNGRPTAGSTSTATETGG
jgi:5'-AMP-activated protein kinase regulatory gamma subunit